MNTPAGAHPQDATRPEGRKRRPAREEPALVIRHHHPEVPDEKVLAAARRLVMNSVPSPRAAQAEAKRPA